MADAWSMFDGAPAPAGSVAAPPPGPAPASAPADPWGAFDGRADAAPAPRASAASGGAPGGSPAEAVQPKTGLLANIGAGLQEGGAAVINAAADPFGNLIAKPAIALGTGAYNLGARAFGYQPLSAETIGSLLDDHGTQVGDRIVSGLDHAAGAPSPAEIAPGSNTARYGRAAAQGAAGVATLNPAGLVMGVGSGIGAQLATDFAPDDLKHFAGLVGGIAGGVAGGGVNGAYNTLAEYARPLQTGAVAERLGLGGRVNDLFDVGTGGVIRNDAGAPIQATAGQAEMAGRALEAASSDPQAVRAALADRQAPAVPGSDPTTFQVTRDPLLGQVERGMARDGSVGSDGFGTRAAAQNDARVAALRDLAPDGNPAALQDQARAAGAAVDQAGQGRVQAVQGLAGQALDRVGGNLPAGSESQVGAALRAPLAATDAAAKAREGQLWRAIDPDGTLAIESGPLRDRAQEIIKGVGSFAAPLGGVEADILHGAAVARDVIPFQDVADLRSRLTDTIAAAKLDPERAQEARRLSMLLDGVHDTMASAANRAELPAQGAAVAPAAAPAVAPIAAAPNVGSEVFTPSGQRVGVRYEVADAGNLVTSHNQDMTPNPAFPPELQPRERDRAASQVQVQNIASRLQPERLGASSTLTDGAPIVGPDGLVESGNGRVMGVRQAYAADGPQAQAYRDWLANQGHDTTGMQQPVLIRRRTTDMTPEERVAFAAEGNTPTTLSMSATERAAGDARRLSDDVLQGVQPGDVTDPANRDFVRSFVRQVVEPGQEGAFVTGDGQLSQEGAARVRAALVHKAYGDSGLSASLAETTDPAAKVLAGAMQDAAGPMARLRSGIEAGAVDPSVDLAPALVEATQVVQQARQKGISLADAVAQRDAFNQISPLAEGLLRHAYGPELSGRMSQVEFGRFLSHYAQQAGEQSTNANLFGAANLSAEQLVEGVGARYGKATGTTGFAPAQSFGAGSDGQGLGPNGGGVRQAGPGAGRQAAPGGGGGQQSGGIPERFRIIQPVEEALTPNFDQAAADRYAAARQATADRKGGFQGAEGVEAALQRGNRGNEFRQADAAVPAGVFRPGAAGADHVRVYLEKGGSPEALQDGMAYSLRQAAMRPDGTLNPSQYAAWAKRYGSALSAMPEARSAFESAAVAQQAVEAMTARHASQVRGFQATAAAKLIGNDDPVSTVGSLLKRPDAVASMQNLARLTADNPDARAGLQRAVADFILRDLKGDQATVTGAETQLKAAQLQSFVRKAGPALREVFDAKQVQTLQAVADDLQRGSLSVSGTKAAGGSDTAQNKGALTFGRALVGEGKQMALTGAGITTSAAAGSYLAGPIGAVLGGAIGAAPMIARAMVTARAAGINTVNDLVREAMLRPELAQVLLSKVTPASKPQVAANLVRALGRASVLRPVDGSERRERSTPQLMGPANKLLPFAATGGEVRRNPLMH